MSQLQVTGEAKIRDIQGPVVANSGVITALDGAASQYVRGDGTLADFPTSTGGGSSVSYYLNGSVNQGTFAGSTYYEMSKTPIIGAGTDFPVSTNGLVSQFITDANDPDLLEVPGGNFNVEFYFSVSNNTGNPTVYAELYKYDGTTFTLLGSSQAVPESINQGTTIAPYYFAIPVGTAALALTDRIAIRIYANVDGRTVTLHTENSHLCQVVTTFSKGMVSLNNLTDQSQYLTTGTSGTNFNIVSSGDTHTFNLPVASATNTGKLSSTDWSTFNNKQAALSFTAPLVNTSNTISIPAATSSVDGYLDNLDWVNFNTAYNNMIVSAAVTGTTTKTLTLTQQDAGTITASWTDDNTDAVTSVFGRTGAVVAQSGDYTTTQVTEGTNLYFTDARARGAISLTTTGTSGNATYNSTTGVFNIPNYTPDLSGYVTIGTTQTITGTKTFDGANRQESGILLKNNVISGLAGYTSLGGATNGLAIQLSGSSNIQTLIFQSAAAYSYTLPATSGTIALTSNISYPVTSVFGRTGAIVAVSGDYNTDLVTEGSTNLYFTNARSRSAISLTTTGTSGAATYNSTTGVLNVPQYSADLSNYVTIATTQTITGTKTFSEATRQESGLLLKNGVLAGATGYASLGGASNGLVVQLSGSASQQTLIFQSGAAYSYTLPASSGTLALTSDLGAYLPLTGGTLTGALSGTSATFSSFAQSSNFISDGSQFFSFTLKGRASDNYGAFGFYSNNGATRYGYIQSHSSNGGQVVLVGDGGGNITLDNRGLNVTGAATFSSSVTSQVTNISADGAGVVLQGYVDNSLRIAVRGSGYNSGARGGLLASTGDFSSSVTAGSEFISYTGITMDAGGGTIRGGLTINYSTGEFKSFCGVAGNSYFQTFNTNGSERMRITSGGNVLIGTTTDESYKLYVNGGSGNAGLFYTTSAANQIKASGTAPAITFTNTITSPTIGGTLGAATSANQFLTGTSAGDVVLINNYSGNRVYVVSSSGGVYLTSGATSWTANSDIRLKNINSHIENAVEKLSTLQTINFSYKDDKNNKQNLGLIAQEVEKIFPELIDKNGDDMLGVRYTELVPVLIKAIQELESRIKQLENK